MLSCFVYKILEGAGHGTQCKHFLVHLFITQYKHTVLVMIPVTGNPVKVALCHKRSLGSHIAPLIIFQVFNPSLEGLYHLGSLRHQKRKSLTDNINGSKQLHLTTQLVVVTVFDIFQIYQILFQFFFFVESSTVNTL